VQQLNDPGDMAHVIEKRRRTHKDAAQAIGLDLIGQLGQFGISSELFPASQMLLVPGLQFYCGLLGFHCSIVSYSPYPPTARATLRRGIDFTDADLIKYDSSMQPFDFERFRIARFSALLRT
jgi:hypothetical protein